MSAIEDFCVTIRSWLNLGPEVYPDPLVTSWVRMAEEYLSETLRVKHMLQLDRSSLVEGRVLLPSDWMELDTVRLVDGKPLIYRPRDEFYATFYLSSPAREVCNYTIIGNYIIVNNVDAVGGTSVEISYYQNIPQLADGPNWLLQYYSRIYVLTTLWHASMYAIEDDRGAAWKDAVDGFVSEMNTKHQMSRSSGSILISKRRSFG